MVVPRILLVHLACRLHIALCCCRFICLTKLFVIYPFVPRKQDAVYAQDLSLLPPTAC